MLKREAEMQNRNHEEVWIIAKRRASVFLWSGYLALTDRLTKERRLQEEAK